jgi:hypothetical protein
MFKCSSDFFVKQRRLVPWTQTDQRTGVDARIAGELKPPQ